MIEGKEAVAIAGLLAGAMSFWAAVYGWGKWLSRPGGEVPRPEARSGAAEASQDERLRRIEAAIETMAVEVERIGEGQRFATKLLAERRPGSAAPAPLDPAARSYRPAATPH